MNPVNAYLVKTGIETTTDTAIDLVTGRPVTPETVFQNLSMNLIGNGVPLLPLGDNKPKVNAPYKPETVTSNFGNTYDITPSKIHTKTTTDNSKIYGTPNSSVYIYIYI